MMAGLLCDSFSTLIQLDERTDACALTAVKRLSMEQHHYAEEDMARLEYCFLQSPHLALCLSL